MEIKILNEKSITLRLKFSFNNKTTISVVVYFIILIIIWIITNYLNLSPTIYFMITFPILLISLFFISKPLIFQRIKDNFFLKEFGNSHIIPISGIYKNLKINNSRVSWTYLQDSYRSAPFFLKYFVNLDNYSISMWTKNYYFKNNRYHRVPKYYSLKFKASKFKYSLISFDFQHKKINIIKFKILIVNIEDLSIMYFVCGKDLSIDFLTKNYVNLPRYYSTKFPVFFDYNNDHYTNLVFDYMGYCPFAFFNLNLLNNESLRNYEDRYSSFLFFNSTSSYTNRENWYYITELSLFLPKIRGEKTFFEGVINEFLMWQNYPFLHPIEWMGEQNILKFIEFFQLYKNSIRNRLSPEGFTNLEYYLKKGLYSLGESIKLYEKLNSILKLNKRRFFSFFNIINGMRLVRIEFLDFLEKMDRGIVRPSVRKVERSYLIQYINNIFFNQKRKISESILFDKKGINHNTLIEHIQKKIKKDFLTETHNLRTEPCGDLILFDEKKRRKIGIAVEVRTNLEGEGSYFKGILAKIMNSRTCSNIDLFLILFCINKNDRSLYTKLNNAINELEQLEDIQDYYYYISPENLVSFFEDIE